MPRATAREGAARRLGAIPAQNSGDFCSRLVDAYPRGALKAAQMTWVIGTSFIFPSYGVLLSDVQVTFADGTQRDMLRKAYQIAPDAGAGFAGSVRIGFALIENLRRFLASPEASEVNRKGLGAWTARHWPRRAVAVFNGQPAPEQKLGAQIVAVFVGPYTQRRKVEFRPNVYLFSARSPAFRPIIRTRPLEALSIGNGADVPHFLSAVRSLTDFKSGHMNAEIGSLGGWAEHGAHALALVSEREPVPGVSEHFLSLAFWDGHIRETTSSRRTFPPDGGAPIAKRLPPLAATYDEFRSMLDPSATSAGARA